MELARLDGIQISESITMLIAAHISFTPTRLKRLPIAGEGYTDEETSSINYRKVGDPIGVIYLTKAPWISTMRPVEWDLKQSAFLAIIPLVIFLGGFWFSVRLDRLLKGPRS
jgi:hypothetical protein